MAGPRGEQCNQCYFWGLAFGQFNDDEDVEVATCHRSFPTIPYEEREWNCFELKGKPINPSCYAWTGPNTTSDYWCGEFKLRYDTKKPDAV